MCNLCEEYGWRKMTCNFCGIHGGPVVAVVLLVTDDPESPPFAFSETAYCAECWREHGVRAAVEHNTAIRECAGVESPAPLPAELLNEELPLAEGT